ncbi:MAG: hypothetical protein KatS3mg120_2469 [Erythrobacter sp.]|nr:MAG: hypothetical protein KatS3mg120_2469 [Erythrobacter sp.]
MLEAEIGGGIADRPPALVPVLDDPADGKGPGQEPRGKLRIAGAQGLADAARGDHLVPIGHRLHHPRLQSQLAAEAAQQSDIALGLPAEGEIGARHHPVRAEPLDEDARDEILGAGARKLGIEVEHQHRRGPGGKIKLVALLERGQAKGRNIGLEEAHRMGIEGGDDRGAPFGLGPGDRRARHGLVPAVKAIEIAQCDHRAAQRLGHGIAVIEPAHQAAPARR